MKILIIIAAIILLTGVNLHAQTNEFLEVVFLKNGNILTEVKTFVNKDTVIVTAKDGNETSYPKKEISEVMKNVFSPSKGYKDIVILKEGNTLNGVQTLLTKTHLIVSNEAQEITVYTKKEISEVKKNAIVSASDLFRGIKPKKTIKNTLGIELIGIPAGEFTMGCNEADDKCADYEKPAHKVKITKPFYMGKYEVTQGQWKKVMGENPSEFKDCGDNCPVESVSWEDVQNFISRLNEMEGMNEEVKYRLPTEAEWEYAALAGTKTATSVKDLGSIAWSEENSNQKTHPIGEKKPNAFGLYDMLGNVWEWTGDWYSDNYYSNTPTEDPTGPDSGSIRVYRGGSWHDRGAYSRTSSRSAVDPFLKFISLGFRLVVVP